MPIIHINVKEKIAKGNKDEFIVCNNSDYEILFDFDKEWEEYNHKTAIVTLSNREFVPILFEGNKCKLPPLQNATFCKIGVMASLENDDATIRISTTTPASINCLESAYDENGEILPPTDDIYQQILAKLNDINTNISRGGTSVTVGGVEQKTWNADSKLDKATWVNGGFNLYGTKYNDPTTLMWKIDDGNATESRIPIYYESTNPGITTHTNGGILVTSTPLQPVHAANKQYVDDGLSGKVPITPDGFPATYAGLFGKTGAGEIEIVTKTSYWDDVENLTGYNNNGSVAGYSHRATGENVLYTGTPDMPSQAANKKYVDDGLSGKVDKVTTAYKIYGTDGNGNQKVYPTGWSASSGILQIMDYTPNGGYNDDGSFNDYTNGTYTVGIPKKPSHATPKKWVEDNFTVYKHLIQLDMGEYHIPHKFNVLSTRSTPYTNASELPKDEIFTIVDEAFEQVQFVIIYNDNYVTGIQYNHNTGAWGYIDRTISLFFDIESDTVVKA